MILRVIADAEADSGTACPWVVAAADGRALREGVSPRAAWPTADRIEGVVPAALARLVAIKLPPVPRQRLARTAAFAIEDQLAAPLDASAIAAVPGPGGATLVAVTQGALVDRFGRAAPRVARLVPEAALAPTGRGWRWYASAAGGGFVRRGDGSSFGITPLPDRLQLPPELAAALALATRHGELPEQVEVAFDAPPAALARWQEASQLPFVAVPAWRWQDADRAAWDAAPDFLAGRGASAGESKARSPLRPFRLALVLAAIALGLQTVALAAQWSVLAVERWQAAGALTTLAEQSGVAASGGAEAVATALALRHRDLLHRAGKPAPSDALPLLARASAPLAALPRGAVTAATFADGAWTLSLTGVDGKSLDALIERLAEAGIDALAAPVASGARLRVALDPTAR